MNPQAPVAPLPTTTTPQGVANVTPLAPPTPTQTPAALPPVNVPSAAAPAPNYTGNLSSQLGNIANYYQIPRQTAVAVGTGAAQASAAQSQFEAQKAQRNIQIQNQQNSLDPTKYQFTKNADGSVSILNSVGDKVDIGTYAALTGANPATALQQAGATDKASQQFITAYNNFQDYTQTQIAAQNGDEEAKIKLGDYYQANPGLQNMQLGQISQAFMQQYGSYFGQSQNPSQYNQLGNAPNVTPTLSSANSPVASSPYYQMQYYSGLGQANPITQQLLGNAGGGNNVANTLSQLQSQATTGT